MKKHLDEVIHDIKVEANYMEILVDVDDIVDKDGFLRCLKNLEDYVDLLIDAKLKRIDKFKRKPERAPGIHERMGGVQMTDTEFKQAQEENDPAPTNQT